MEQYEILWKNTLLELEKMVDNEKMKAISYNSWIIPLTPIGIKDNKLILTAATELIAKVSTKYLPYIEEALSLTESGLLGVEILVGISKEDLITQTSLRPQVQDFPLDPVSFNPKYTFESFVVGGSNKFVHAAAQAVAKGPGGVYNPLFIYGGAGLGKTHIIHAIGNFIKDNNPSLRVAYVTGEKFTNELIESIRAGRDKGNDFRAKYRSVDVLMIDDIQFIGNKPATQEEFFHTFNELYGQDKQIIISSDRPPKEISLLEERLRTRFEMGLIADVQPPDLETKVAILQKKAEQNRQSINIKVLTIIADKVCSDVRELEGLLNRVVFQALLAGQPVTEEIAREALKDYSENKVEEVTTENIIKLVCDYYSVAREDLIGKKKNKEIVDPRQICMYLMTEFLSLPLTAIGQVLGGRDHTTIIHARDKITELLKTDERIYIEVNDLRNMLLKK